MQRGRKRSAHAAFESLARVALVALVSTASVSCVRARSSVDGEGRVCPPGGEGSKAGCRCRSDLRLLAGACVTPRIAADRCGPSAIVAGDGCEPRPPCEAGRPRDLATGECLPRRDARAIATTAGILVADDELLECSAGRELVMGAPDARGASALGCIRPPLSVKGPSCPAGSIRETSGWPSREPSSGSACTRIIEGGPNREQRVDVLRWLQGIIGAEGGGAAPPLCEALAHAPRSLAVAPPGRLQITVSAAFQDNDVSQLVWSLRLRGTITASDPAVTVELSRAVAPLMEALRALGGTASQAAVETSVALGTGAGGGLKCSGEGGDVERPTARLLSP